MKNKYKLSFLLFFNFIIVAYLATSLVEQQLVNLPLALDPLRTKLEKAEHPVTFKKIISNLDNPWGIVFLPTGELIVTEINGRLLKFSGDNFQIKTEISGVPKVHQNGQGGLLDVVVHPQYSSNSIIYLSYSSPGKIKGESTTAILRARLENNSLTNQKVIYRGGEDSSNGSHYGSRMTFDHKGFLYFSIGDRGLREINPQDVTRDGGKIYRIYDDGKIPEDNPFYNISNAKKAIYTLGNRNPQGLVTHPVTGQIWEHEHGPRGGDEINIIESGKNYGWPIISYGINYNGTKFAKGVSKEGMQDPVSHWTPSIAPCGMTFVTSERYPKWKNNILLGSLKFNHLIRVKLDGRKVKRQEKIAENIGRVRDIEQGPDGFLYVAVQNEGIFRLN